MIVGIAIDSWKLTIFDRRLTEAGFLYVKGPGVTDDTLLLRVQVHDAGEVGKVGVVVEAANTEASRSKEQN